MNISVVIPVHNSVPFLQRCLSSVLPQLDADDEVLLLENGSSDDSLNLCKEYAASDSRVHVQDLGPCGVSHARNEGIRLAACDLIMFLDSDDFLTEDALTIAHSWPESERADILCFDFITVDADGHTSEVIDLSPASDRPLKVSPSLLTKSALRYARYEEEAESNGFNHVTIWTCWAKFFRKDFLRKNNITFPEGLVLSEDTYFMVHAFLKADTVYSFPKKIYSYRTNENSASRILHPKQLENNCLLRKSMYCLLRKEDPSRKYREELAVFLTRKLIEELIYTKQSDSFSPEDAVRYIRRAMRPPYMSKAVERCGYTDIIAGKKNSLVYGFILWCLKHGKEMLFLR